MGWFGTGALDGDDGMDLQDELFNFVGVNFDDDYNIIQSDDEVRVLLESKQNEIYDWLKNYDWGNYNPGFKQAVYIQAVAQIFINYGVKINERGRQVFLRFIKNDLWAQEDSNRKESMDKLYNEVEAN